MIPSRSYSSSASAALSSSVYSSCGCLTQNAVRSFMHSSALSLSACSASRFGSRSRALWRLAAPVAFLAMAILYATFSIASDFEYMLGMRQPSFEHFDAAARLFPFFRERRLSGAWWSINALNESRIDYVEHYAATDPYAPDLKLGLARLLLNADRKDEYNATIAQLEKLTPTLRYQVVRLTPNPH